MEIYDDDKRKVKLTNPRRIRVPIPTPSPCDEQLHRDNLELIKFLNSLKNRFVWFK